MDQSTVTSKSQLYKHSANVGLLKRHVQVDSLQMKPFDEAEHCWHFESLHCIVCSTATVQIFSDMKKCSSVCSHFKVNSLKSSNVLKPEERPGRFIQKPGRLVRKSGISVDNSDNWFRIPFNQFRNFTGCKTQHDLKIFW